MKPKPFEELLAGATPGPYFVDHHKGTAEDFEAHARSGLATVDTGRSGDWPVSYFCEWPQAQYFARLEPAVMREVWEALKRVEEHTVVQTDGITGRTVLRASDVPLDIETVQLVLNALAALNGEKPENKEGAK